MSSPPPLQPGVFYHIYNRGTNRENIFVEQRNYPYFLQLYVRHIGPVAETYAYCLLKNHFHVLVRIKDDPDPKGLKRPLGSMAFSNFFNAYAKAINKAYQRTGSLFQHPFGRIQVDSQAYLLQLVRYIHRNPQKHGLVSDFREWPYSSYHTIVETHETHETHETLKVSETFRVCRDEGLSWFDNLKGFSDSHHVPLDEAALEPLAPGDFD